MVKNKLPKNKLYENPKKLYKNDIAWITLFDELNIESKIKSDGFYKISAKQINEISDRQARLMTKFDHKSDRPVPFKQHNLAILPDSRGTYVLGNFKAYASLDYESKHPIKKQLPVHLASFDIDNITSESVALNIAHASGMIDDVLNSQNIGESVLTLSGRMSSTAFDYFINTGSKKNKSKHTLHVSKSQLEIDGSYENLDKIAIIEAKNRVPEDFLVRQLYYPFRMYNNLELGKELIPIFFTFADDIFSFHIYKFTDLMDYSSIKKVKQMDFVLNETIDITLQEINNISENIQYVEELITVPQANDFIRVMDMLDYLEKPRDKAETARHYKFQERQSDYYFNALKYLGFAERKNNKYSLTKLGIQVEKMRNSKSRNLIVISKMLEHKPFNLIYKLYTQTNGNIEIRQIMDIFSKYAKAMNSVTNKRRSESALSWIEWIYSNIEQ